MSDNEQPASAGDTPASLAGCKTILLQTRKRDGTWIGTPVSLVVDSGRAFFRTYDAAGKSKRLRNFPEVKVAPSTLRGKPTGAFVAGSARKLAGAEAEHARSLLAARFPVLHGRLVPMVHRRRGWTTEHYELTLAG